MEVITHWREDMHFVSTTRELNVDMDAKSDHGGHNKGLTPKEMLLSAVCGCTAMDVISMLNKMRLPPDTLKITANAEQTKEHPAHFIEIKLGYYVSGKLDSQKLLKSVEMSMTKYCGVSYMLSRSCPISYEVFLNEKMVGSGKANFS